MSKRKNNDDLQVPDAFLQMCGITYGEFYVNFNEFKYYLPLYDDVDKHIDALIAALKKVTEGGLCVVSVPVSDCCRSIFVNGGKVMDYKKSRLSGRWYCKRKKFAKFKTPTARSGEFLIGLVDTLFNPSTGV